MTTRHQSDAYFAGFRWALRRSFARPLGFCRFEQGDVIYDTPIAYERTWDEALKYIHWSVQIKSPARGMLNKTEKDARSVFVDNWNQAVTLELIDYDAATTREVSTTQGRLYTLFWRGEIECLAHASPNPPIPKLAKDVLRRLDDAVPYFRMKVPRAYSNPIGFLIAEDPTNEVLSLKHVRLQAALSAEFKWSRMTASPRDAGLSTNMDFAPTLAVACYAVESGSLAPVEAALKRALYVPGKARKTDRELFKPSTHGRLVAL